MDKFKKQMAVRYASLLGENNGSKWESSLDKIFSPGCFMVEIDHNESSVGLPIETCGDDHYIVGTLLVTDSGTTGPTQHKRVTGQLLIFTSRKEKETKMFTRTHADGTWSTWRTIAQTGMYDDIANADELYASVAELVAANKKNNLELATEITRATEAEKKLAGELATVEKRVQHTIINYNEWKGGNVSCSLADVLADEEFVAIVTNGTIITFKSNETSWKRYQYTSASVAVADITNSANWKDLSGAAFGIKQATDANKVQISTTGENGSVKDILNISAATRERAGVMSADMLNAIAVNAELIENKVILAAGSANTNANFYASDYIAIPNGIIDLSASGWIAGGAQLVAFYDSAKTFISGYGNFGDATSTFYSIVHFAIPETARYVRYSSSKTKDKTILVWGNREYNENVDALLPISIKWIDGEFVNRGGVTTVNSTWCRSDYVEVSEFSGITIKAYSRGTVLSCAFYDANYKYLSGVGDYGYTDMTEIHINVAVPAEAKYMRVSTAVANKDDTTFLVNGMRVAKDEDSVAFNTFATQTIPAQFYRKQSGDSLRVLCFGSSWLTNTWWYLNKLTQAVGINATIKCYFSSSCPFSKWVDRFEGKTEETGSDFRRFDSLNGSDWSVEYVTDAAEFKTQMEEDWDVIVFQQGSSDSTDWDSDNGYANHYQKLMSYVKRSAKPWTVICYNNTWTPKLGAGSTQTKEAQQKWQELNNENCIKFTNAVGLSNFVIPCGAAVWALRNDSVITDADDFMKDDLHIKNGLPIYLTGLTLFRAVVTPFYGIDIDDVAWLPDESTQKNPASENSWLPVDSEQAARVKQMVKLAFSYRYGFYTL